MVVFLYSTAHLAWLRIKIKGNWNKWRLKLFRSVANGCWWLQGLLDDITSWGRGGGSIFSNMQISRLVFPINEDQWICYQAKTNTHHTQSNMPQENLKENILYLQAGNHLLSKDEWTFIHQQCCSSNGWTDRRRLFKKKRPRHYQASFGQRYSFPFPFLILALPGCIS